MVFPHFLDSFPFFPLALFNRPEAEGGLEGDRKALQRKPGREEWISRPGGGVSQGFRPVIVHQVAVTVIA
jgi:hypothetical protein